MIRIGGIRPSRIVMGRSIASGGAEDLGDDMLWITNLSELRLYRFADGTFSLVASRALGTSVRSLTATSDGMCFAVQYDPFFSSGTLYAYRWDGDSSITETTHTVPATCRFNDNICCVGTASNATVMWGNSQGLQMYQWDGTGFSEIDRDASAGGTTALVSAIAWTDTAAICRVQLSGTIGFTSVPWSSAGYSTATATLTPSPALASGDYRSGTYDGSLAYFSATNSSPAAIYVVRPSDMAEIYRSSTGSGGWQAGAVSGVYWDNDPSGTHIRAGTFTTSPSITDTHADYGYPLIPRGGDSVWRPTYDSAHIYSINRVVNSEFGALNFDGSSITETASVSAGSRIDSWWIGKIPNA